MNILIKLMSIVSLVLAPTLAITFSEKNFENEAANRKVEKSSMYSATKTGTGNAVHLK